MDKIEYSATIRGTPVKCTFIFDKYEEKNYNKDFKEFVAYQKRASLTGELGEKDLKFLPGKNLEYVPFEFFRENVPKLFSQSVFFLLEHNPDFIVSDEFNLQMKLMRIPNRSYYFNYDEKAADPENACFDGAGIWFIQTIAAPFFYSKHIDFSIIMRYFVHELVHHMDFMTLYTSFESKYKDKIHLLSRKRSAYCLNYLYSSMFNLREEGFADFIARANTVIDINTVGIREYNKNMVVLTEMSKKLESEAFYVKKIGWENLTTSGEYANGRMMCAVIAMYAAKYVKEPYALSIGKTKLNGYDFNWNALLSKYDVIFVSELSTKVIAETVRLIQPTAHYSFVQLYEKACDFLNISEDNRIMTARRFYALKKRAEENAIIARIARLRKRGFDAST